MKSIVQSHRISAWLLTVAMLLTLLPCISPSVCAADYDTAGAVAFIFSDTQIAATGGDSSDYAIDGTHLKINSSGTYILGGSCSDGSVTIKKGVTGVTLVLSDLTLTAKETAPIVCAKSTEVTIAAADGTVNALSDGVENNGDNYPNNADAENAVIKCKDGSRVTLCGSGTLNITANGKNGIKSGATTDEDGEAWLLIRNLTLNITANVNDAVNAEQLLTVESGDLTILAGDDALHCDLTLNIGAQDTAGPTITVSGCYEGLEGATVNVYSGNISIIAQDDCINAANSDLSGYTFSMNFYGGNISAYSSEGDGFDSNGTMAISGGSIAVWTANTADNQPLDADGTITITGGTVLAAGGSAGMGMHLQSSQGYVTFGSAVMASGRPGGMGGPGSGRRPDNSEGVGDTPPEKPIGPSGDSTDEAIPQLPANNSDVPWNAPNSQDDAAPGSQDAPSVFFEGQGNNFSLTSGQTFTIVDDSGNDLYSESAVCNAGFVFFSSPDLTAEATYTLSSDTSILSTATAQTDVNASDSAGPTPPDISTSQPTESDDTLPSGDTQHTQSDPSEDSAGAPSDNQNSLKRAPLWPLWILLLVAAAGVGAGIALLLSKLTAKSDGPKD